MYVCNCDCCEAMHACVHACVYVCTRRMLTLIAVRRCMHVWECVFELVKAHGHCDCCEAMHACACLSMNKARTHMRWLRGDACMCASVFGLVKAYSHCNCCEAMHAFVGVYVWACTRHMRTLIAAAMHVCACLCVNLYMSKPAHIEIFLNMHWLSATFSALKCCAEQGISSTLAHSCTP
jgi:hypothetical protein